MAPPTVTGMSVQFQPLMQTQVVESSQIIEQTTQPNYQTQIQHINQTIQQPMQQQMQQMTTMQQMQSPVSMQQQIQSQLQQQCNDNQQKMNGIPYSVQNLQSAMQFQPQVNILSLYSSG